MKHEIKKIAVIGAGAMGSGIAAQAANAGYQVVLLDKRPDGADKAVERMLKAKPTDAFNAGFMHPSNAKLIETGNTDQHMDKIADADLVIEAVFEDLKVKHFVFGEIYKYAKKNAIITSNTSTIELEKLVAPFPSDFRERFVNTHFFNPVRYMHLLEIIDGLGTDPGTLKAATDFCDRVLGKKVIRAKDSPGFIANRIGIYAIERAKFEALKQGTKIEDIDAIMGPSFGFTHLGLFKLADEVGVDIVYHVGQNLKAALLPADEFNKIYVEPEKMKAMIDAGYTGKHKGKGGFYALKTGADGKPVFDKGKPVKLVRDLATGDFRDAEKSAYERKTVWKPYGSHAAFFDSQDPAAKFAWPVLRDMLVYTLNHAQDIAYDIQSIDDAMRAGYNWQYGPFQLIDKFGVDWFRERLKKDGVQVPALLQLAENSFYMENDGHLQVMDFDGNYNDIRREDGVLSLDDVKSRSKPLVTHHSASLWDIGDGVVCLEFHSQQNTIDPSILWVINESIKMVNASNGKYKAMVIYNDAPRFSVGANLGLAKPFMYAAENKWMKMLGLADYAGKALKGLIHEMTWEGQAVYTAMNQAPFPVIGAPKGQPQNMVFGGGCEALLNCDAVQAGPEQIMALPETGAIGLVPAWTGSTRYLERAFNRAGQVKGPMAAVIEAGMALANPLASGSTSSQDAKAKLWLRPNDGITMNPDRVLADAKKRALEMVPGYKPKPLPTFRLPGPSGKAAIRMNVDKLYLKGDDPKTGMNHVDVQAVDRLADVLTGGETLEWEDVFRHAASHHNALQSLIAEKPKGCLTITPAIELSYNRMMQIERDRFMNAFNDRANIWPRIRHLLATNTPLREPRPDPAPMPDDLRACAPHGNQPRRDIDGQPLSGRAEKTLKALADMTAEFYAQHEPRSFLSHLCQLPATLRAVGRALRMV